ncbi:3-oxoacyl-[acyl-carrier-protein] synthase-3 [Desulfohalotomaculum tongense]|uniref:beta-ketoacyl-ACP synthase III n=1 Tax=Desulforadius tongensis TaxID=1216062 RepID=UPI00195EA2A7|nr:beta-ketoacyl-ACP synthase III [Desulforadius tongensis]MBM7854399.1 3-oxoacyl-[acyl-carrier-protein] synthase-3 [Desulforadius tongensis]
MTNRMVRVGILGVGSYVPEKVLTNKDLEAMVDTSDQWITTRTGIKERRIAAVNEAASDLGVKAGVKALKDAAVAPEEIDLIIVATSTPDMYFPSTACIIQDRLNCVNAGAFDLAAGCTGFLYALVVAEQFVRTGSARYVLVIGSEVLSRILNWEDRTTCVLFGDGAGAVVMGPVPGEGGVLASYLASEGSGAHLLTLPCSGSRVPFGAEAPVNHRAFISMQGKEVFKFAVRVMEEATEKVLAKAGLDKEDIHLVVPHQANIRIIEHYSKKMNLPMERIMTNVDKYGNTSAASVPLALEEALQQGRIKSGDNVLLIGFGAGLTWGAAVIKWV